MVTADDFSDRRKHCFYGDQATHMVRRIDLQNKQTACGKWVWSKASKSLARGVPITCQDCVAAVEEMKSDAKSGEDLLAAAMYGHSTAEAVQLVADYRAAVLRQAAIQLSMDWGGPDHETGMDEARQQLRRMAVEAEEQ
jgi:hypothetical protein